LKFWKKICEVKKMSEAFEILSSALNEAIEDAKSSEKKLERREVEIEIPEKKLLRKNNSVYGVQNFQENLLSL